MSKFSITAVALAMALAGCAGRAPAPVATVQPQDQFMDCVAIMAEVESNNAKVAQLGVDQGQKTAQNVVVGVAGLFIPVLWFGMDFQGTADKETQALQARQQYLASVAGQRRCGEPQAPPPHTSRPRATPKHQQLAPTADAQPRKD